LHKSTIFFIIEDATEALGSYFETGAMAGRFAGTIGDMGVYSFNGNKIITTGSGGMIVSPHKAHLARARHLSKQAKIDLVYFIHDEAGYNYRMTNIQAALGVAQIEQLEHFVGCKKENYHLYQSLGVLLHPFRKGIRPNYWFYSHLTEKRDALIKYLTANNVQSRPIWHLIHELPFYRDSQIYYIEKAKYYWELIVNIPCSSNLPPEDVERVAFLIAKFCEGRNS
jgi:perosamine synthetase